MEVSRAARGRDLRITAYNRDLGFVTERRRLPLARGRSAIEITDIPALIDPTSVHLTLERNDAQIVEQDFQYDLAEPDRILQRYLDHPIEAVLKESGIRRGKLLSYDDRALVLRSEEGEISLVLRSEVVDARLPGLPEGLRTRPTLLWLLDSQASGEADVELSYLTGGVGWHAEYVAVANEDDSSVDLAAWISLENRCGAGFTDAQLQLIAGGVHRLPMPSVPTRGEERVVIARTLGSESVHEEPLFEYHLYTVEQPVTIADRETKQIALFSNVTAPVTKSYRYEGGRHSRNVDALMEIENREDRGLGMPLPGGAMRIYKEDSTGRLHFIGEDLVDHTPRNENIRLRLGTVFDIVGERKTAQEKRVSGNVGQEEVEVRIRNRKQEPVEVTVRESLWYFWRILRSSHEYTPHGANTVDFKLRVPADGEEILTFTYRYGG